MKSKKSLVQLVLLIMCFVLIFQPQLADQQKHLQQINPLERWSL